jgi:outer membrane protein OmpA-like peptidoglycan-associated protein
LKDSIFKRGDVVKIPVLYFDLDRNHVLNAPWYNGLDSLKPVVNFLNAHPHFVVEVSGHTDTRTGKSISMFFSRIRAQCIRDTLVKLGIDSLRLTFKGYEGKSPLIPDVEIKKLKTKEEQERAHQINRRIELKILRTDYGKTKTLSDSIFEVDDIIKVPGIRWDLDNGTRITSGSKDSIDAIAGFLKRNKNLVVEVDLHTDCRGSVEYNFLLSEERAKAIAKMLIRRGVDSLGVTYRGYGETQPLVLQKGITLPSGKIVHAFTELNENFTRQFIADKSDFEFLNGLNRRTELRVLRVLK